MIKQILEIIILTKNAEHANIQIKILIENSRKLIDKKKGLK